MCLGCDPRAAEGLFGGRPHSALTLLDDVPKFMRKVLLLPGSDMDVGALRVGVRRNSLRSAVVVDAHVAHVHP